MHNYLVPHPPQNNFNLRSILINLINAFFQGVFGQNIKQINKAKL